MTDRSTGSAGQKRAGRAGVRSQAWFWTPEWQKNEREADADIKAGRVFRAKDVKELIASLKR